MASEYEKKLINLQVQMKENQMYMSDYFKDLDSWTEEIKEKEKKLLDKSKSVPENEDKSEKLPPVRSLATTKKKKKKPKTSNNENKAEENRKIKAYDYRTWDKFDVDAACKEVDEKESSESEYTTDEEWEEEQRKIRADWEKDNGNLLFQKNEIDEAINCYTRAIELNPSNAIYPANRAMCLLKQEKYGAAEMDCTLSITLDPRYVKAYLRRGAARVKLNKLEDAQRDFERVLALEPNNKTAKDEINKIQQINESKNLIFPINKPVEQQSKKPLVRVPIREINNDDQIKVDEARNQIKSRIKLNENEEKMFDLSTSSSSKNETLIKESSTRVLEKETPAKSIPKKSLVIEEFESKIETKQSEEPKKVAEKIEKPVLKPKEHVEAAVKQKVIPGAPTNSFQFRKDWQILANNIDDLTAYFKQIPPDFYEKLFLNGLESDMLKNILIAFKNFIQKDTSIDISVYMKNLSKVKRFKTQLMFLSSDDKKIIQELLDHVKKSSNLSSSEMDQLKDSYTEL